MAATNRFPVKAQRRSPPATAMAGPGGRGKSRQQGGRREDGAALQDRERRWARRTAALGRGAAVGASQGARRGLGRTGGGGSGRHPNRPPLLPFYSGRTKPDWAASGPSHAGVQASRTRAEPPPSSLQNCNKASKTLSIYILAYSVLHIYN